MTPAATPDSRPRLARGLRFQWEPAQDCHVLLYPEGMVKLNPSAGEIVKRCDGERRVAEIVAELEETFDARGLEPDVMAFLAMAGERRWLTWDAAAEAAEAAEAAGAAGAAIPASAADAAAAAGAAGAGGAAAPANGEAAPR